MAIQHCLRWFSNTSVTLKGPKHSNYIGCTRVRSCLLVFALFPMIIIIIIPPPHDMTQAHVLGFHDEFGSCLEEFPPPGWSSHSMRDRHA